MEIPFPKYEDNLPNFDDVEWLSQERPEYSFMEGMMSLGNKSIASMFPSYSDFKGFQLDKGDLLNFDDNNIDINDIVWENSSVLPYLIVGLIYMVAMLIGGIVWCCCKCCCASSKKIPKKSKATEVTGHNFGQQAQARSGLGSQSVKQEYGPKRNEPEEQFQYGPQEQYGPQPQHGLRAQLGKQKQVRQEGHQELYATGIQLGLRAQLGKSKQGSDYGQQGQYGSQEVYIQPGLGQQQLYGKQEYKPQEQYVPHPAPLYSEKDDNKSNWTAARIICYVFMGCWLILFLVLLISSFGMNVEINNAIDDLPSDINYTLTDVEKYLSVTKDQFNAVFVKSYEDLSEVVHDILANNPIIGNLDINDEVYSGTEAFKIQKELTPIKEALALGSLTILNSVKLLPTHYEKEVPLLSGYVKELQSLKTQMETLEETILKTDEFSSAHKYLNKIGRSGNFSNPRIMQNPIIDILAEIGVELKKHNTDFGDAIEDVRSLTSDDIRKQIKDIEDGMEQAKPYLYNTMWVVLSILVVILVAIAIGTIVTGLGNSKDLEWCNRLSPASFFNSGMIGMFVSGFLLMMLCLVLYVLCGFVQIACQGIREVGRLETSNSDLTRGTARAGEGYNLPTYAEIVTACDESKSAYTALNMSTIYNIEDILDLPDKFKASQSLMKELNEKLSYEDLENTLSTIKNAMQGASENLQELLKQSDSFLAKVDAKTIPDTSHVETFQLSFGKQVKSIEKRISTVEINLAALAAIQISQKNLATPKAILDDIVKQVDVYSNFVYATILKDIGQCKPMYNALDTTIEVFCYKVSFPIFGFWMSLTFLLLLYIAVMITVETLRKIG